MTTHMTPEQPSAAEAPLSHASAPLADCDIQAVRAASIATCIDLMARLAILDSEYTMIALRVITAFNQPTVACMQRLISHIRNHPTALGNLTLRMGTEIRLGREVTTDAVEQCALDEERDLARRVREAEALEADARADGRLGEASEAQVRGARLREELRAATRLAARLEMLVSRLPWDDRVVPRATRS